MLVLSEVGRLIHLTLDQLFTSLFLNDLHCFFQSKDSKILILTVRFVFGPEEVLLLGVFVNGVVNGFFGHVGL